MRARNIKPGFFENEDLHELPVSARLMFIGMWCMADREGRIEDRPKKIKLQLMPYDDIDTEKLLSDLAVSGFITRYSVNGCRFIQIENFLKHQHPHPNEKPSVIPSPETAALESRLDLAKALLDERITEDEAGMDKDEAASILVSSTSNQGVKRLTPRSEVLHTKVLHTQADSLNPDSLNHDSLIPDSLNPDSGITDTKVRGVLNALNTFAPTDGENAPPSSTPEAVSAHKRVKLNLTTHRWEGITPQDMEELKQAYPACCITTELNRMAEWVKANPSKRKSNWYRFLTNWLSRSQDKGGSGRNPPGTMQRDGPMDGILSKSGQATARNMAAIIDLERKANERH